MEVGSARLGRRYRTIEVLLLIEGTCMRLASFKVQDKVTWGMVERDSAVDVGGVPGQRFPDLKALIAQGGYQEAQRVSASAPRYPLESIKWLPVIPNPDKVFCVGLNYE